MDLLSPDDISAVLSTPFVVSYWPLLLGTLVLLIIMIRGSSWLMVPTGIAFGLLQAWHMGVFVDPS